jgi:hypothetical protein
MVMTLHAIPNVLQDWDDAAARAELENALA